MLQCSVTGQRRVERCVVFPPIKSAHGKFLRELGKKILCGLALIKLSSQCFAFDSNQNLCPGGVLCEG